MEEVWKDINLGTLNEETTTNHQNLGGVILQDFLARPFSIEPPNSCIMPSANSSQTVSLYCNASPPPPSLLTALSLSSHPHFHFDKPSPSSFPATKRFPQPDCTIGDRRNKRMIKNRESAARSRARKQAYTNELELEVEQLKEENARLKRQQQQLCEAAASEQKKKGTLYRASTAPF